ncbi:hypothetical protein ACM7D6_00390 [Pseudomonas aeruginosa]|uniref:hypothetical protein n=1 Tax=Pseudomonas aeruginosa TaxID=287 RepID=UPI0008FB877C|nr:hypothetical protein [Pseudomonas aeruginosa]MBH3725081.1 hypothetical protein [Pseudomonas aeruginosa]MBH3776550.1 hypothetical protein [Pseudomonas aeruginosa]MCF3988027.1 hypothetical protein [Pseudomonas aeruginosa]MCF3999783.1 hypothetical protein [Pseudomonas aeruginosa]MCS8336991.1 hypothetical protein [Pseudomonas aeruginosa]
MNYPSIDNFFLAIGQDSESAPLQAVFSSLGIGVSSLEKYPMNLKGLRIWSNLDAGLQLEFKDVGLIKDMPHHDIDEGPWVLERVIFWGQRKKKRPYVGPMPYGLNFSMSREAVREAMANSGLGQATVTGSTGGVDVWIDGAVKVAVGYFEEAGVHSISMGMPVDKKR